MAGSEEQSPKLTTKQLVELIKQVGRTPIERGTLYDVIQDYTDFDFANDVEVTVN
jgi:aminodeoxyfutalosine synthase